MQPILQQLVDASTSNRLVPFVGAGVSMQSASRTSSSTTSWWGLLRDGIDTCAATLGESALPQDWKGETRRRLDTGDLVSYLSIADELVRRLKEFDDGTLYAQWIDSTVGKAELGDASLPLAILAVSDLVVTTNYDQLLEQAGGQDWGSVNCSTSDTVENDLRDALNKQGKWVVHLHGIASDPGSVVLGSADYERMLANPVLEAIRAALATTNSFLFIGCGDGLRDPSLAPLIKFIEQVTMPETKSFLLVRGKDLGAARDEPISQHVVPIAYGSDYDDLEPFLRALNSGICDTSQNPDDYLEPALPRLGLLEIAGPAEQRIDDASDSTRRAQRALRQVLERSHIDERIGSFSIDSQREWHRQAASSAALPAERLANRAGELVMHADLIGRELGRIDMSGAFARKVVASLHETLQDLLVSVTALEHETATAHDEFKKRIALSDAYRKPAGSLGEAASNLADAAEELGEVFTLSESATH